MDRRHFLELGVVGALGLGLGGVGGLGGCSRGGHRPDIYLIVVDSLRADRLGCYGHEQAQTPALDALALDSLLFRRCLSAAPWTSASVAAMLTGQFPSTLGIRDRPVRFDPGYPTLPGTLHEHGYRTSGIVSVDMLSKELGFAAGFDSYDDANYTGREGLTAARVMGKAKRLVAAADDTPTFALLHVFDPHYNYIHHEGWAAGSDYRGPVRSNHEIVELWGMLDRLDDADRNFLSACYDSEVAYTDRHIGAFLDELHAAGRYDDALIIVTGDHGEEFFERGWLGHSISVHREQIHVPLLVKMPGNRHADIATAVSLLDIFPSLLQATGIEPPAGLEGSAHDWSSKDGVLKRPVFSETFHAQQHRPGGMQPIALAAVEFGGFKMIRDGQAGHTVVYDLAADPDERQPRRVGNADADQTLQRLLSDWWDHVDEKRRGARTRDATQLLDTDQLERLRTLGYI